MSFTPSTARKTLNVLLTNKTSESCAAYCLAAGAAGASSFLGITPGVSGVISGATANLNFTNIQTGVQTGISAVTPNGKFIIAGKSDGNISSYAVNKLNVSAPSLVNTLAQTNGCGVIGVSNDNLYALASDINAGAANNCYLYSIDSTNGTIALLSSLSFSFNHQATSIKAHPLLKNVWYLTLNNGNILIINQSATNVLTNPSLASTSSASCFTLAISPDGRFAYSINQNGSIDIFSLDLTSGYLTFISTTSTGSVLPISGVVTLDGNFLLACGPTSAGVVTYQRNVNTGALTLVGIYCTNIAAPYSVNTTADGTDVFIAATAGFYLASRNVTSGVIDVNAYNLPTSFGVTGGDSITINQ